MLTVLTLDSITRQLAWRSFQLKLRDLQGSGGAFDFDASAASSLPKTGSGKLFVMAVIPQALSNVVTIQQAGGH
jgi:hypothetical protein